MSNAHFPSESQETRKTFTFGYIYIYIQWDLRNWESTQAWSGTKQLIKVKGTELLAYYTSVIPSFLIV